MKKYFYFIILSMTLVACTSSQKSSSNEKPNASVPKLLKPTVRKIWIPPEIRNGGKEWTEGYFLYRIEKDTSWSR